MAHRLVKTANAANLTAEMLAETVVALQDLAQACIRLAEELEPTPGERKKAQQK